MSVESSEIREASEIQIQTHSACWCVNRVLSCFVAVFQAEVEETLKRIQAHKGVIGTVVVNAEGNTPVCFNLYLFNHYNRESLYHLYFIMTINSKWFSCTTLIHSCTSMQRFFNLLQLEIDLTVTEISWTSSAHVYFMSILKY